MPYQPVTTTQNFPITPRRCFLLFSSSIQHYHEMWRNKRVSPPSCWSWRTNTTNGEGDGRTLAHIHQQEPPPPSCVTHLPSFAHHHRPPPTRLIDRIGTDRYKFNTLKTQHSTQRTKEPTGNATQAGRKDKDELRRLVYSTPQNGRGGEMF